MIFAVVALFLAVIALIFSLAQVRTLRRTHGPSCLERDESYAWASRLLTWGVAMSVAALTLLPAASDRPTALGLLALDAPLIAGLVVLRRMQRTRRHELLAPVPPWRSRAPRRR